MNIDPRLDPEIAEHLERVQVTMSASHRLTALEMRESFLELKMPAGVIEPVHEVREIKIPAAHGTINARLYKPTDRDNIPLLVWYHGGGWVLGDLESADMPCRDLAVKSGCAVLSVDYRLAPEHPFPAAYDDSVTALRWTFENAESLGADASRIAIGGDSAGANLAAVACIANKDDLAIKFQLLVYPVVEPDFTNSSYTENADGYFLTRDLMKWFWDQYIPDPSIRDDPRVSPLKSDLRGLPPAWLLTVHFDPLRDEGIKYAAALQSAGVRVESTQIDDTVHGFFTMPTAGSAKARAEAGISLKNALM